jgi:hypothetical protein
MEKDLAPWLRHRGCCSDHYGQRIYYVTKLNYSAFLNVLKKYSFTVEGVLGAGKTTVVSALGGLTEPVFTPNPDEGGMELQERMWAGREQNLKRAWEIISEGGTCCVDTSTFQDNIYRKHFGYPLLPEKHTDLPYMLFFMCDYEQALANKIKADPAYTDKQVWVNTINDALVEKANSYCKGRYNAFVVHFDVSVYT